ncbi:MAG: nucleotide exchange factor GrpE [Thermoanaerobaculia bacterium]
MSERESQREFDEVESDEFEIEPEDLGDLEAAMRDALKAVESAAGEGQVEKGIEAVSVGSGVTAKDLDSDGAGSEVSKLQAEVADLRDRSARILADFDNFRKRSEKERDEDRRFANADVFRQLLPVIDNLERALSAEGSEQDLKVGVDLILRQIKDLLASSGVERVAAMGSLFDPQFHEAVSREEDPSVKDPTVIHELQSGFTMHGRLLRPAVVMVAMPAVDDEPDSDDGK